jgi:toxin ParE1/3/4
MASPRRLVLSARAEHDLRDIRDYLVEQASENVAISQLRRIESASLGLIDHPFRGRPRPESASNLRSVLVKPYVIFYRVEEASIEVLRVLHGMRDISAALAEPENG